MINPYPKMSEYLNLTARKNNKTTENNVPIKSNKDAFSSSSPSKKSKLESIKEWLLSPVETVGYSQTAKQTRLTQILGNLISFAFIGIWIIYLLKMSGRVKNQNSISSASKLLNIWQENRNIPNLKDLALPDKLKDTAKRLIYKIQNPVDYFQKGGTNKKTILLYGPPGTGKTTFARAISKEFPDSRFASIDLSAIEDKFVGESQRNLNKAVNEVCDFARNNPDKKVFVFFDEIDSIAIQDNGSSNQQYHATVLNTLKKAISEKLTKFDNIITLAATNVDIDKKTGDEGFLQKLSQPIIDRFDEKIRVDNPTSSQFSQAIARHYSTAQKAEESLKNADSKEVKTIAEALAKKKSTFRVLENIYNTVASTDKPTVGFNDIMEAINNIVAPNVTEKIKIGFVQ